MRGEHVHVPAAVHAGARHRSRLAWALALVGAFFVVELVGGILTGSIALLSDAAHMLTDVAGLTMALAAIQLASHAPHAVHRTFGLYRLEILAALGNAALLFGLAGYVTVEGVRRLAEPRDVATVPMLIVACIGLVVNLVAFGMLRRGAHESLNVRGASLEVIADALASVGVIVAAVVLMTTGWQYVDPIVALAIAAFILPRTWRLASHAVRILVQAAPAHIDLEAVRADLAGLPSVVDVHDLHVWTLTSGMDVASAHVMIAQGADMHATLNRARDLLRDRFNVLHATLQIEPEDHQGCEEISW